MTKVVTDRIEKSIVLRAPLSRVWRALTDSREFGTWFRVALEGPFEVGRRVRGSMTYPGVEGLAMDMWIERLEPERLFAFRWHPGSEPPADPATAPTTLVELRLEEVPEGTRLTVVESGFDRLPAERRASVLRENDEGWSIQLDNVRRHVDG